MDFLTDCFLTVVWAVVILVAIVAAIVTGHPMLAIFIGLFIVGMIGQSAEESKKKNNPGNQIVRIVDCVVHDGSIGFKNTGSAFGDHDGVAFGTFGFGIGSGSSFSFSEGNSMQLPGYYVTLQRMDGCIVKKRLSKREYRQLQNEIANGNAYDFS